MEIALDQDRPIVLRFRDGRKKILSQNDKQTVSKQDPWDDIMIANHGRVG